MDFSINSIQPKGRLKYGTYYSSKNITTKVQQSVYNGNASTGGGNPASGDTTDPTETCVILLQHNTAKFERSQLAVTAQTDDIMVIGYRGTEMREVFVSDLSGLIDEEDTGTTTQSPTYDITGSTSDGSVFPVDGTSGITVAVSGNGSSACTISVTVDSSVTVNRGTLLIPVSMCLAAEGLEDDYIVWKASNTENSQALGGITGSLYSTILEYNFELDSEAQTGLYLDLTNDSAGINVDSDGNVLTGATRPTCQAILYYGVNPITSGVTYGVSTPAAAAATGVSINTATGVLTFGSNFNFQGTSLEITVSATYVGHTLIKIMTISKNYPGADGTGATTRWIVPSASQIKYDPNLDTFEPQGIEITVMVQVNDEQPVADNTTVFWYDWDKSSLLQYTGRTGTVIDVENGAVNKTYLAVGLKNSGGTYYEMETIPVLSDGMNGTSGESAYRLDLSNEMEYVNATYNGEVISGQAQYLSCTATLYYGSENATGVSYSLKQTYAGISINSGTGVMSFTEDYKNNFGSDDVFGIKIQAKVGNVVKGAATMKLIKNKPGAPGDDAIRYWLSPTADAIRVSSGGTATPSTISCAAYKQVGGGTPTQISSNPSIYWGYNTMNPGTLYAGQSITVDTTKDYLTFQLWGNSVQYDIETIPILHDGTNGQGRSGAAILGPTEWTSATQRRWHSGNENAVDTPTEEDLMFLDIILRVVNGEKIYYYCNTSYTQSATTTNWNTVSQYWTQADEQFDFVAAKLILADNASIDFMTNNELYLRAGATSAITAGAAGGYGVSFWAGGATPGTAPFRVNYDGTMTATKGIFGCLEIGNSNNFGSMLEGEFYDGDGVYKDVNLNPSYIRMTSRSGNTTEETLTIAPAANTDKLDVMGTIEVIGDTGSTALYTNERVVAGSLEAFKTKAPSDQSGRAAGAAIIGAGLFNLEVVMQTSTSTWSTYFTKDGPGRTWRFKGVNTNVSYDTWPNVAVQTSVSGSDSAIKLGYWAFYYYDYGAKLFSGIAGPNITKQPGIIYIQI